MSNINKLGKFLLLELALIISMMIMLGSVSYADTYTVHLTHSDIPEDVLADHYDPDPDCNLTDGYTYDIADPSLPVYCLDGYYGEEGLINSYVIDKILINDTECPIPSDDGDDIAKNDIDGIEGAVHFVRDEAGLRIKFFEYNDFTGDQEFVKLTKDLTIEFKFKKASAPASVYTVHLTHSDIPEDVLADHYDPDPDCNLTDGYTYDIADPSLPVYCLDGYYGEEGLINSYVIDKILINDTECPIPSDDGDDIAKNDIDGIEGAVHFVRDEAGLRIKFFEYNDFTGDQEFVKLTKDLTIEFKFKKASAPAHIHSLQKINRVEATCVDSGTEEYWKCTDLECGKLFSDELASNEISEPVTIPSKGHVLEKTEATAASYTKTGNSEYYTCKACGKFFSDADGKNEIENGSWVIDKLSKKTQPMKVTVKKVTVKFTILKKKTQTVAKKKVFIVKNSKGTVSFKKTSGNKKITVSKAGKVTVKKGLKKGTYKVKVKVTAAGTTAYKAGSKTVTVKIVIK